MTYTPTTEGMKQAWYVYQAPTLERKGWYPSREAIKTETDVEFDRWLEAHDREVKAQALEEAARDARFGISRGAAISLHHECHKHQCKCGNPSSTELVRQCFLAARDELLARAQQLKEQ